MQVSNRQVKSIHGFGFANVLMDLGLSKATLGVTLFGFNLGVELGQLVIVLGLMPIAFSLRRSKVYRWGIFRLGSVFVASIAVVCSYERISNTEVIGF